MKTQIIDSLWVFGVMALAFTLRVVGQIPNIFINGQVIFREADPYYHMRLAENMAANYPHLLKWDYFAQYPDGVVVSYSPILSGIIATVSNILGLGHPSIHLVDIVGAWVPPVAACLVCLFVYLIGVEVFKSKFVGVFSGVLVASLPTEFMHRSLLGFVDHHVLEVLFSIMTIYFIIKAFNTHNWKWGIGAAVSFALYAINWIGWPIFALILSVWLWVKLLLWLRSKNRNDLALICTIVSISIIAAFLSTHNGRMYAMAFFSNVFLGAFGTIQEASPINFTDYFTLYGLAGLICFAGLFLAIRNKYNSLFILWSAFFAVAMICEKRWGYYGTIPVALFSAYAFYWVGRHVAKDWKPYVLAFCCITTLFTTTFYELGFMKTHNNISPQWYNACVWLRNNTPYPYSDTKAYYEYNPGKADYGIFSWWDYGHWIIQIGHRPVLASPTQQESKYYEFFTAANEAQANGVISSLNVKYVVIDSAMVNQIYYAIYKKVYGTSEGWQTELSLSMAYKMYYGQSTTWKPVAIFDTVKIFARVGDGN